MACGNGNICRLPNFYFILSNFDYEFWKLDVNMQKVMPTVKHEN